MSRISLLVLSAICCTQLPLCADTPTANTSVGVQDGNGAPPPPPDLPPDAPQPPAPPPTVNEQLADIQTAIHELKNAVIATQKDITEIKGWKNDVDQIKPMMAAIEKLERRPAVQMETHIGDFIPDGGQTCPSPATGQANSGSMTDSGSMAAQAAQSMQAPNAGSSNTGTNSNGHCEGCKAQRWVQASRIEEYWEDGQKEVTITTKEPYLKIVCEYDPVTCRQLRRLVTDYRDVQNVVYVPCKVKKIRHVEGQQLITVMVKDR